MATPTLFVLPTEHPDEYTSLTDRIADEMRPATEHERFLVDLMTQARWKLKRIAHLEEELLERTLTGEPLGPQLSLLMRYTAAAQRTYYQAHREFTQGRREQHKENQAVLNQSIEKCIMAPPPKPLQPKSASFGKSANSTAAAAGNLALRL